MTAMECTKKAAAANRDIELADQLHSVAIHLLRRLRRIDSETGISGPALSALSVVVFSGPVPMGTLAAAEQVRPPSMTRIVAELESEGLVRRLPDKKDKRVALIQATAKGQRILVRGRDRRVAVLAEWLKPIKRQQRRSLEESVAVLEQIVKNP